MKTSNMFLSPSVIQVYRNCKRRYKYKYIERVTNGSEISNKNLSYGQSIHLALAKFNMITDKQFKTLDILHRLLRCNWIRKGYADTDEEREYGKMALEMLSKYYNDPHDISDKNLLIECMIKKVMDGKFTLSGKLDKVYLRTDGLIETTDYKTGNIIEPLDITQLSIYTILTHHKLGAYPNVISNYYLVHNQKVEIEVTRQLIEEVTRNLWQTYEDIKTEQEFPCTPTLYCETVCEFFSICDDSKDGNLIVKNELNKYKNDVGDEPFDIF